MKIKIQRVKEKNIKFLYTLNNHPEIRKYSNNPNSFSYKEHKIYWKNRLKAKEKSFIITLDGKSIGSLRNDNNLISIAILPNFQGKGIGTKVLKHYCKKGIYKVEILPFNPSSLIIFSKAGFKFRSFNFIKE